MDFNIQDSLYLSSPLVILLIVIIFCLRYKLFTTPAQLERTHRSILNECRASYSTLDQVDTIVKRLDRIENKVDRILERM